MADTSRLTGKACNRDTDVVIYAEHLLLIRFLLATREVKEVGQCVRERTR
jgi:hypothetical protein